MRYLTSQIDELDQPVDCFFFADCESAIRHFSENSATPPEYVFIDIRLTRMDGDVCLQELKKLKQFDHSLLVIYSSAIPQEWKAKLSQNGFDRYLEKTGLITEL